VNGGSVEREVEIIRLGSDVPYEVAYRLQRARVDAVAARTEPNALFLVEHAAVLTLGRAAHQEHLLATPEALSRMGIAVVSADRGGDITYHGPGQLVAYPVLNLVHWRKSVNWYLRTLEETLIVTLATYGLRGERMSGLTGIWVDGAKVAAIGVGLRRWVTYHGIALNVNPNMGHFAQIVPCGISDRPVTSLARLLGEAPPLDEVTDRFIAAFRGCFVA
jgi:lipoate-protein ligase B